jgi:hypothetical protein
MMRVFNMVLVVLLCAAGAEWSYAQNGGPAGKDNGKNEKELDSRKDDRSKDAKRASTVTLHVKVSGGGSILGDAAVEVTNEHEYDPTKHTNADGVATFSGVPREGIAIVVTARGWKNFRTDLERKDLELVAAEMTIPVSLIKE